MLCLEQSIIQLMLCLEQSIIQLRLCSNLYFLKFSGHWKKFKTSLHFFVHAITICKTLCNLHNEVNNNPLMPIGSYMTYENWPMNWPDFAASSRLACTQQTHCGMHAAIFSHTQMITQAGSLVYVQAESGHDRAHEEICGPTDHFQQYWNGYGRQRIKRSRWV